MQNIWLFFTRYYHWMMLFALELISIALLFRFNSYQGSVWVSSANAVAGKVYEWQASIEQFFSLTERSEQLSRRNVELEHQLWQMRQLLAEQGIDSVYADSTIKSTLSRLTVIPAKVVSSTLNRPDNLITIDRGRRDGVAPDMGVACGTGLVGVVYLVGDYYSVVLPVLNVRSRISCAIRDKGYFGYLLWDGKSANEAYMEDIPRHAQFEKGEWIETSGYSSIFPPGITAGQITGISNSVDGLSYRLKIRLSTDFARLRDVYVINDPTIAEQTQILQAARDSLNSQ
ncbi:MAG: rod shape-determining protein MreC [Prevotella sp.]|nr:rod shape-determining protein MreC [Prevotella sp.]